jgi:acyl-CoA thioesterase
MMRDGTAFSTLLAQLTGDADGYGIDLPADWLQGRTAFGGLTAALSVTAALRSDADLLPLRSAQVMLAGPASGPLRLAVQPLRAGKSSRFLSVDVTGDAGFAARSLLSFGASRASQIDWQALPMPPALPPEQAEVFFKAGAGPGFSRHFETAIAGGARPFQPTATPELLLWVRHRDVAARQGLPGLVAVADTPPAAALVHFPAPAPFSTMTWSFDLLCDAPQTDDGWWLIQSRAETITNGYSAQSMTMWNRAGQPVLVARQMVALFI